MTSRSWISLLLVFMAIFGAVAFFSYRSPQEAVNDVRGDLEEAPTQAAGLAPVRLEIGPHRPRILYTYRTIQGSGGLRRRVAPAGRLEEPFQYLLAWAGQYLDRPTPVADLSVEVANTRLRALALCHLAVEGDREFGAAAARLLAEGLEDPLRRNPDFDWIEFGVTEAMVFDWCHDMLDDGLRRRLVQDMVKRATYVANLKRTGVREGEDPLLELLPLGYLGVALAGEEGTDDLAQGWLALFRERFFSEVLRRRSVAASDGAAFALSGHEASDEVWIARLARTWESASGENLLAVLSKGSGEIGNVYPANAFSGWLASTAPDGTCDKYGANTIKNPAVPPALFYELAGLSRNGEACAAGDATFRRVWQMCAGDPAGRLQAAVERILSDNFTGDVPDGVSYPEFRAFKRTGVVYVRQRQPADAQLWLVFRTAASPFGGHLHQNHLSIVRSGDHLGIDAGYPQAPNEDHIDNYFSTPFAHNTVIIKGAAEAGEAPADRFEGYSAGRLMWSHHDDVISAACGRLTITSAANKAEFVRVVALVLGRYIMVFDTILMHRTATTAVWLWHSDGAPELDGSTTLLEGKRTGGIVESTDSRQFTITSGASALLVRTLYPEAPVIRVVGGERYEFRSAHINHPVESDGKPVAPELLRAQLAGRYRVEVSHNRPGRRLYFVHLAVCGEKADVALPEVSAFQDANARGYYLRDRQRAIEITLSSGGGRLSVVVRDRATGQTLHERDLGEGNESEQTDSR